MHQLLLVPVSHLLVVNLILPTHSTVAQPGNCLSLGIFRCLFSHCTLSCLIDIFLYFCSVSFCSKVHMLHFQCASPISFAPTNHKKGFQAKVNLLKFIEIYILRYDITTTFKIPL